MSDFLTGLSSGMGQSIGGSLPGIIASWATGGFKGRPQWRDLSFMNDVANRLQPDETKRQGEFLEGLAPSQGAAHNTFQDATYGQDTQRSIDRIKTTGEQLGMSPWELTGSNTSTTPIAPQGAQGDNFMQTLTPVLIAKMNNQTALKQTAMQTQNALQLENIRQGGGKLSQTQIMVNEGLADLNQGQADRIRTETITGVLDFVYSKLPIQKYKTIIGELESRQGWQQVLQAYQSTKVNKQEGAQTNQTANAAIKKAINSLEKNERMKFLNDLFDTAKRILEETGQQVQEFLPF